VGRCTRKLSVVECIVQNPFKQSRMPQEWNCCLLEPEQEILDRSEMGDDETDDCESHRQDFDNHPEHWR